MTIRKLFKMIPLLLFVAFAGSQKSIAAVNAASIPSDSTDYYQIIIGIKNRLTEIQHIDKTNLTSAERKDLRKELKEMKHQAVRNNKDKSTYLLVVAILIIVILLLILLL